MLSTRCFLCYLGFFIFGGLFGVMNSEELRRKWPLYILMYYSSVDRKESYDREYSWPLCTDRSLTHPNTEEW